MSEIRYVKEKFIKLVPNETIENVNKITKGYSHDCWIITTTTDKFIFKINKRKLDIEYFKNEVYAQQLLFEKGIPVPKIINYCEEDLIIVSEFIDGMDAGECLNLLSENEKECFFFYLGQWVAKMHSIKNDKFTHDILGNLKEEAGWVIGYGNKTYNLLDNVRATNTLKEDEIDFVYNKCLKLLEETESTIIPAYTHRDLYLNNFIIKDRKFKCLIDFEGARFYDPVIDFVKLEVQVFNEYPSVRYKFYEGYQSILPFDNSIYSRYLSSIGFEMLGFISYFGVLYPDRGLTDMAVTKIKALTLLLEKEHTENGKFIPII
ncbi:MAG: hypothetical protein K0S34_796 [Bacillales bacterium]|jgi:fructosamine-3-kinase|nr:hypothetical protein [Bacillales bacterium]